MVAGKVEDKPRRKYTKKVQAVPTFRIEKGVLVIKLPDGCDHYMIKIER